MGLPPKSSILFWDILGFAFIARTPLPHDPDGRVRVEGRHHAGLLRHAGVGSGGSGEIWIYNICTWVNIIYIYTYYIYIYCVCKYVCVYIYIYLFIDPFIYSCLQSRSIKIVYTCMICKICVRFTLRSPDIPGRKTSWVDDVDYKSIQI